MTVATLSETLSLPVSVGFAWRTLSCWLGFFERHVGWTGAYQDAADTVGWLPCAAICGHMRPYAGVWAISKRVCHRVVPGLDDGWCSAEPRRAQPQWLARRRVAAREWTFTVPTLMHPLSCTARLFACSFEGNEGKAARIYTVGSDVLITTGPSSDESNIRVYCP